ncbi:MAG TPA: hypothetical protein VFC05_04480 [Nitrososphaeraceae archaeon]|nr:hypothetical protein [Nitrososphaeraceae archaeon]
MGSYYLFLMRMSPALRIPSYIKFSILLIPCMTIEQTLLQEIDESKRTLDGPIDDTIYRREHSKRIELINWVLENMKNPDIQICEPIKSKMNEIILKVNQTD